MKKLILMIALVSVAFADIRLEIANSLKKIAYDSKIDARVLYTIASIESNFEPYIISFLSSDIDFLKQLKKGFENSNCKFKYGKYDNNRYAVSISSKDKEAMINIADVFWDMGFNLDFGVMQISKQNITRDEIKYIFTPAYNIAKGAKILDSCNKRYSDLKNSIECYNKGFTKKKKYSYYVRFESNYKRFFGDII